MNILWLAKRRTTNQDLYRDAFGRLGHIPRELSRRGNPTKLLLLDPRGVSPRRRWVGATEFIAYPALRIFLDDFSHLRATLANFRPDLVVGSSDPWICVAAAGIARRFGSRLGLDLQDNFHAYRSAHLPGVRKKFVEALRGSAGLSVASGKLRDWLARENLGPPACVVANGVPELPRPRAARTSSAAPRFGYVGDLHPNRGFEVLFAAWPKIRRALPEATLWLCGRKHRGLKIPHLAGLYRRPPVPHAAALEFLSTMDVALVLTEANAFGTYAAPYKFFEAVAHGIPVLCGRGGEIERLLGASPGAEQFFYGAGNVVEFAERSVALARRANVPSIRVRTWQELTAEWAEHFRV